MAQSWQRILFGLAVCLAHVFLAGAVYAILADHVALPMWAAIGLAAVACAGLLASSVRRYWASTESLASGELKLATLIRLLIEFVILMKLLYLGFPDLIPEEAYYWQYALRPALCYVDHPPAVAWGILGGTALFGETEFGFRILFFLCGLVSATFLALLAKDCWSKQAGAATFLLTLLLPFPFTFGIYATPDSPLIAAWAGALYFVHRALIHDRGFAWIGFGACLGLGMLSKYSIGLMGPAVLLFMVVDRNSRRWFLRPEPWLGLVACVALMFPVLLWNYENDWVSFMYQTTRRLNEHKVFQLDKTLINALILITPWGVLGALSAIKNKAQWSLAEVGDSDLPGRRRVLFTLIWGLAFGLFAIFSIRHRTKMNWTGPAWVTMVPVLAAQWIHWPDQHVLGLRWVRPRHWFGLLVFLVVGYAGGLQYLAIGLPGVPYRQSSVKPVSWEECGQKVQSMVEEIRQVHGWEVYVVGCNRFAIASELAFYRRDGIRGVRTTCSENFYGGNGGMFEQWFQQPTDPDVSVLFISLKRDRIEDARIADQCRELSEVQVAEVTKRGKPAGRFYYRIAHGFTRKR